MSAEKFEYTWKSGPEYFSRRCLTTNRPLEVNSTVIDLVSGDRYRILAIGPAGPHDREFQEMPATTVQAWPAGAVPEADLLSLRVRARYVPDEHSLPFERVVFF